MSTIKAELNVKRNSTDYDQLHLTSEASLINYTTDRTGASSINKVNGALDYLMNGKFINLPSSTDLFTYVETNQKEKSVLILRIMNGNQIPSGYSNTDNDFYFISIMGDTTLYFRIIGIDVRSNNVFLNCKNNGTWVGWENISNAKTLDGITRTSFMQNYPNGTGLNLNSTTYVQPYVANIEPSTSIGVGLPNNWWHLMYLPHNTNGYGCQVAFPLDSTTQKPKYRIAIGTTWQDWQNFNDGGNAETVDGYHANPAIGTPALKQIYAGTSDMVAGTTNLAQGTVYFVYE